MTADLFCTDLPARTDAQIRRERRRASGQPHGYAALPGTGPAGETCGSCAHLARMRRSKTYLKCELMRAHWTRGPGTDIRARSPACRNWARAATEACAP